jgi:hypothetical protein
MVIGIPVGFTPRQASSQERLLIRELASAWEPSLSVSMLAA